MINCGSAATHTAPPGSAAALPADEQLDSVSAIPVAELSGAMPPKDASDGLSEDGLPSAGGDAVWAVHGILPCDNSFRRCWVQSASFKSAETEIIAVVSSLRLRLTSMVLCFVVPGTRPGISLSRYSSEGADTIVTAIPKTKPFSQRSVDRLTCFR